jgi:hypothetical protein
LPGATSTRARAVNNSGLIGGNSGVFGTLWDDQGNIYKADDLLAPAFSAWRITTIRGMNESGWLTGEAVPPGSTNSHAVLLRPVPEPASLTLLLTAGAPLALSRGRRGR